LAYKVIQIFQALRMLEKFVYTYSFPSKLTTEERFLLTFNSIIDYPHEIVTQIMQ
jgi:hypothetical protein